MSWGKVEIDVGGGPGGLFKWILIATIALFVTVGVLNSVGMVGGKAVESAVLKNSFQYKEGMEQRAALLEASIIELDIRIAQDPSNQGLRDQKSILSARLRAITINQ